MDHCPEGFQGWESWPTWEGKGAGVSCLKERGFGSDPTVIFKSMIGLGIQECLLAQSCFFSEDKKENRLKMEGGLYSAKRVSLWQFGIGLRSNSRCF